MNGKFERTVFEIELFWSIYIAS